MTGKIGVLCPEVSGKKRMYVLTIYGSVYIQLLRPYIIDKNNYLARIQPEPYGMSITWYREF